MTITLRSVKGAPLSHNELDGNFEDLDDRVALVEDTGAEANPPAVTQTEALMGTSTSLRSWSPLRVAQAALVHGGGGGGGGDVSLPVNDTTSIAQDPVDNSRQVRIDAGAVAASTTRVIFMGNRDVDLALNGTFKEDQTVGIGDGNLLEVDGTPLSGEFAVFTAAGINGLSASEAKTALAIEVADITDVGTMASEAADDFTATEDLGALALLDEVSDEHIEPGAVSGHQKWGDVENEPAPVSNVSTISLADHTDHLILTNGDTQTLVINEPAAARNLTILNTTGGAVEVQDDALSTIYAALDDDHMLLLVYTGSGWDVKADINTVGGGSSQQLIVDGTEAEDDITEITAALIGTSTYRIVQFDQAMVLDNALGAAAAFALWNTDTTANTVTIEAGAGGQGLFDDGESTVDIPPNGIMTFVVISNAGDEPAIMKRGDHVAVNVAGRPLYGGSVLVGSVSGTLDATHIGGRWLSSGAFTVPVTQFGADVDDRAGWFWCVIVLGADTHDITFNSEVLDVSGQSWGTGDKLSITVTSATTIEIERTAAADIVTAGEFA